MAGPVFVTWNPSTPRRVSAILLSAILPGGGHMMLGRTRWAVAFVLLPIASMALVPTFGLAAAVMVFAWRLVASVHAAFCAPGGSGQPSSGKTIVQIGLLLVLTLALTTGLRHDVVENVTVMDGSMYPTLETGDYLVIDKTAYGVRIPFTSAHFGDKKPAIGELIAFDDPDSPDLLGVARLVARGPSTYALAGGELVLGGIPLAQTDVAGACNFVEVSPQTREWGTLPCTRRHETLAGRSWDVVLPPTVAARPSIPEKQLPAGTLLVASDNRRGTALKIVREDSVRGRVKMVWVSTAGPGGLRWNRAGLVPQ